jgi:hypothetical protein
MILFKALGQTTKKKVSNPLPWLQPVRNVVSHDRTMHKQRVGDYFAGIARGP